MPHLSTLSALSAGNSVVRLTSQSQSASSHDVIHTVVHWHSRPCVPSIRIPTISYQSLLGHKQHIQSFPHYHNIHKHPLTCATDDTHHSISTHAVIMTWIPILHYWFFFKKKSTSYYSCGPFCSGLSVVTMYWCSSRNCKITRWRSVQSITLVSVLVVIW